MLFNLNAPLLVLDSKKGIYLAQADANGQVLSQYLRLIGEVEELVALKDLTNQFYSGAKVWVQSTEAVHHWDTNDEFALVIVNWDDMEEGIAPKCRTVSSDVLDRIQKQISVLPSSVEMEGFFKTFAKLQFDGDDPEVVFRERNSSVYEVWKFFKDLRNTT